MKTLVKTISKNPAVIIGIGIVIFIGYSQLNAHVEEGALAGMLLKKSSSVSFENGRYRVDTSFIRNDLNKEKLIADLEKQALVEKKTIQEVPDFIWRFLDSISSDNEFDIVNPGEEWKEGITNYGHVVFKNVYDPVKKDSVSVLSGDGAVLPDKLLVYFGMSDNIALMSFVQGGTGPHPSILIFKHKNNKVVDFWFGGTWRGDSMINKSGIIKSLKAKRENNGC